MEKIEEKKALESRAAFEIPRVAGPGLFFLRWVLKARKVDGTRPALACVNVDQDGFMCCTDGHRLHRITPQYEGLPAGNYKPVNLPGGAILLVAAHPDVVFPDYHALLPTAPEQMDWVETTRSTLATIDECVFHIVKKTDQGYNLKYLTDALADTAFKIGLVRDAKYANPDFTPLYILGNPSGDRSWAALVMPINMNSRGRG